MAAYQLYLYNFLFSLRKSTISFMPFPFIHQLGPVKTHSAISTPTFLSMEVTSALPAAGGWGGGLSRGAVRGIYNKVALTVELKTFTQVYISTSATAIETRHATKQRAVSWFVLSWCWSQAEESGGTQTLSQVILYSWNNLGFIRVVSFTTSTPPKWDSR